MTLYELEFCEKYVALGAARWRRGETLSRFQYAAVLHLNNPRPYLDSLRGFLRLHKEGKSLNGDLKGCYFRKGAFGPEGV